MKVIISTALYTGLRLRNILHLQWKQIKNDSLVFGADEMKGGEHFTLPLHPALAEILRVWRKQQNVLSPCVFVGRSKDKTKSANNVGGEFDRVREKAGLGWITFHTLRHTFASNFIQSGGDIATLSELLDHSDISITKKRYVHLTQEHKRDQMMKYVQTL